MKRENQQEKLRRAGLILRRLKERYRAPRTALRHSRPLELLVATILSAQCTDERVNIVTKSLFSRYRRAEDYATAQLGELENEIRSTGFYRVKARNIINCAKILVERFDGKVPGTMEQLLELPGVGRKTANVVLGDAFGKAEGVVVDTHVRRLSGRLGLTKENDPGKIEQDLIRLIPRKDWTVTAHLLIAHGRAVCRARKPGCERCLLADLCPSAGKFP